MDKYGVLRPNKSCFFVFYLLLTFAQTTYAQTTYAQTFNEWKLEIAHPQQGVAMGGVIYSGTKFNLLNERTGKYIVYERRTFGINLVWNSEKPYPNTFSLERKDKTDTSPLKYGEALALHNERGGYIKYKKRGWGINLTWSTSPVYEWIVTGDTNLNEIRIRSSVSNAQHLIGLYNNNIKDYVVNCKRQWGIDLKWLIFCKNSAAKTAEFLFTYHIMRQPVDGIMQYYLEWNPGLPPNAYMKSIGIPSMVGMPTYVVHLMKKDMSFKDCGKESASVTLKWGETTSEQEIRSIYGTTKPRPPVPILACITQSNPIADISRIPINIKHIRE